MSHLGPQHFRCSSGGITQAPCLSVQALLSHLYTESRQAEGDDIQIEKGRFIILISLEGLTGTRSVNYQLGTSVEQCQWSSDEGWIDGQGLSLSQPPFCVSSSPPPCLQPTQSGNTNEATAKTNCMRQSSGRAASFPAVLAATTRLWRCQMGPLVRVGGRCKLS